MVLDHLICLKKNRLRDSTLNRPSGLPITCRHDFEPMSNAVRGKFEGQLSGGS
jgi:hypothetical protein